MLSALILTLLLTGPVPQQPRLSDEQIDTLVAQLKLIKETGFLKSDVWDNPDRIKKEFFWRG